MWESGEDFLSSFNNDSGRYNEVAYEKMKHELTRTHIWWDLDGVLREIDRVGPCRDADQGQKDYYHESWEKVKDWLNEKPDRLQSLPDTEYADTVFKYYNLRNEKMRVITCQPNNWRHNTIKWIHSRTSNAIIYFTDSPKGKIPMIYDSTKKWCLIEDYPFFDSYENIILIDRPYNRNVDAHVRITSARELIQIVEDIEHGYDPWKTCRMKREAEESLAIYQRALQACK